MISRIRLALAILATVTFVIGAGPALAKNDKVPPGNPCAKGNGNPCNGNNGNIGRQGNAGHEKVKIDKKPPPIDLAMPPVSGRGAFITQIGDSNVASIVQTAPNAFARVDQDGDRNEADTSQHGSGSGYIESKQKGDGNFARLQQDGPGQNVAYLTQTGNGNWAWADQNAIGGIHNGARLTQTGNNNDMMLTQNGGDNRALLAQQGDDNGMTATQNGEGNRLIWTQTGSGLTDLQIVQNGGATQGGQLQITQTRNGGGK